MKNETQLERYKKLLTYIDEKFKEDINIEKVEEICHYSYRNINRIFQALNHETIGKYVKRIRLEKAAQYLKYSEASVSDIAFDVGFEDVAAFSKAFKKKYQCSPSAFRASSESVLDIIRESVETNAGEKSRVPLQFEIEYLPDFEFLCLEYKGAYEDQAAINKLWEPLAEYALKNELLTDKSIFMIEVLDDNEISEHIHCRCNLSIILDRSLDFEPEGLFKVKTHRRQKYVKFIHKGPYALSPETYNQIYAYWMLDVKLDLVDLPTLEFYLNDEEDTAPEDLITEIYIPVK